MNWESYDQDLAASKARKSEDFYTERMTIGQRRALRSAKNETIRSERMLRRAIGDDALQAEMNGGRMDTFFEDFGGIGAAASRVGSYMSTATKPLFDLIQIGQFTTAGAVMEIVNGGNSHEALKRASSEFINALPFFTEEDAAALTGVDPTRASFRDIIANLEGTEYEFKPFENERHNEYAVAAAGLVLDIVLDPLTWAGPGVFKLVGRGAKAISTPFLDVAGIRQVRQGIGRRLVSKFELSEVARTNPALKDSIDSFTRGLETRRGEITEGALEIKDMALQLRANLAPTQARFLQLYLDQPKHFEGILNELTVGNPGIKELMMNKFNAFKNEYKKLADAELKAGIMDPTIIKANYAPSRWEATHTSQTSFKALMTRLGLPEAQQGFEISDIVLKTPKLLGEAKPGFAKGRKLHTVEQRVLASIGTELDPGIAFSLRGIESVRARATKRFVDSVLEDPNIALKVTDSALIQVLRRGGNKNLQQLVEEFGPERGAQIFESASEFARQLGVRELDVWRPFIGETRELGDLISVNSLRKGTKFIDEDGIVHTILGIGKKGSGKGKMRAVREDTNERVTFGKDHMVTPTDPSPAYVMPRAFINELNLADKIIKNPDSEGRRFLRGFQAVQNLWKGWAIASPGFHARNHMSNMFNNALAGVGFRKGFIPDPTPYARAFALQWNGAKSKVALSLPDGTRLVGKEITDLAVRHNVMKTGVFAHDVPQSLEDEMLNVLFKSKNRDNLFEKLENATGPELDKLLANTGGELAKPITRRDLLSGIGATAPAKKDFQVLKHTIGSQSPVLRLNRLIGEKVEDHARLSHFIDKIGKGATPEEAAFSVKRYLFDYGELTEFERDFMKTMIPFYTWMRKNIPLQFQSIMENPGRYGALTAKPIDALESLSDDWKDIPTPDYFQEIHAVRMPKEFASLVRGLNDRFDDIAQQVGFDPTQESGGVQPVFINPNFPFQDINRLNFKDMLSSMSPLVKLPAETMLGEQGRGFSIFLERPIERYPGEPTKQGFLGSDIRPSRKTQHILETIFPTIGKAQRLLDRVNRGQAVSQIASEFFGIKAIQVDVDRANRSRVYRRQKQIRAIRQKYQELGVLR